MQRRQRLAVDRFRFESEESLARRPGLRASDSGSRIDLERAIGFLPDGARSVFVLHDVEGFKHEEIAEMLGVTSGTTKAQLHRARMILREHLRV